MVLVDMFFYNIFIGYTDVPGKTVAFNGNSFQAEFEDPQCVLCIQGSENY